MSDETQTTATEEVPPAPVPDVPASEEKVTLKTPPSLLEKQETPQSDPAAPEDEGADKETGTGSEGSSEATEGVEEGNQSAPVVETNPSGQTVTFPDGRVVYTRSSDAPVSNTEWREYEKTHQGDQLRYPFVPGDREYTPYSDPNVPNSHLAQQVEREITSFAERVLLDPKAEVSYIWNALHGVHESELDRAIATGGGQGKAMA